MAVTMTIRNVPEHVRDELAARAARSGQSMQEYVLAQLGWIVERPDPTEFWARVRERKAAMGTQLTAEEVVAAVHEGRR